MLIKARLKGHECDLLTLAELFRAGDPAVATDDEGYYLRFTIPDELFGDGGGLHDGALVLLRRVNGVAHALSSDVRPVGLTGRFSDEAGRQHQVVLAHGVGGWGAGPATTSAGSGLCGAGPDPPGRRRGLGPPRQRRPGTRLG